MDNVLDLISDAPASTDVPEVELTIVMPCLNEVETLGRCIAKARAFLDRTGIVGEIIVGDNGSTDGSQSIARSAGARVISVPVRGYGAALYGAMAAARGRYCIMGDSDDSYDFASLDAFVEKLRAGHDLVMGNRFAGGIAEGAMPWKNRYIGNPILSGIGRLFFGAQVRDFHCGLRGLSIEAFRRLDLRTTGMEYASEMVIKATLLGLNIAEVPTKLAMDGRSRPPHLKPYRDGWRHLRFMLLFSPNWLFFYPGLTLLTLGVLAGAILLSGPVTIDQVRFSLDTLIYCSAMVCLGIQAILFAILSRNFAIQEGLRPRRGGRDFLVDNVTLEHTLGAGATMIAIGFGATLYAVRMWQGSRFGALDFEAIARVVVGSALALTVGVETIFAGFLLSTFRLNTRSYTPVGRSLPIQR